MGPISYDILADESFYRQAFGRHRAARYSRREFTLVRILVAILLLLVAINKLLTHEFGVEDALFLLAAFIVFATPWIEWLFFQRRLRQSPFFGEAASIRLDDEGLHGSAQLQKDSMVWASCTKAIEFNDGILLYHGPSFFRWLPNANLDNGTAPSDAVTFIRRHVENFTTKVKSSERKGAGTD